MEMIDLDYSVTYLDYAVTYPYPAPAVFDAITDFPAYPWWQPHGGVRAAGALPSGPGSQVLRVQDVMGHETDITLTITEYEQDRLLTCRPQRALAQGCARPTGSNLPATAAAVSTSTWHSTVSPRWPSTSSRASSAIRSSGSSRISA